MSSSLTFPFPHSTLFPFRPCALTRMPSKLFGFLCLLPETVCPSLNFLSAQVSLSPEVLRVKGQLFLECISISHSAMPPLFCLLKRDRGMGKGRVWKAAGNCGAHSPFPSATLTTPVCFAPPPHQSLAESFPCPSPLLRPTSTSAQDLPAVLAFLPTLEDPRWICVSLG